MAHIIPVASDNGNQGPLLNRVSIAQYMVALVVVTLRFLTRGFIVKRFMLDDLFIGIAVILGGAQTITLILQVENGRGRHSSTLHVDEYNRMLMYKWINLLVYFAAIWAVKMSILALYYRIGSGRQSLPWIVQGKSVLVTAGVMTAFSVAVFVAQLFTCVPISRAWDINAMSQDCFDGLAFMQSSAAINIVMDTVLLLFPFPLLPLLRFNTKQRTALAIIFSIGLVPVVASTMRLCEIIMAGSPFAQGMSWKEADTSWTWSWVPMWSQIEVDVGIVAASLPSLSPLLKLVWTGFTPSRASTPSQVPTLPGFRKSWGKMDEPRTTGPKLDKKYEVEDDSDSEKQLDKRDVSFYDDDDEDEEEEEEVVVGTARTINATMVNGFGVVRAVGHTTI